MKMVEASSLLGTTLKAIAWHVGANDGQCQLTSLSDGTATIAIAIIKIVVIVVIVVTARIVVTAEIVGIAAAVDIDEMRMREGILRKQGGHR